MDYPSFRKRLAQVIRLEGFRRGLCPAMDYPSFRKRLAQEDGT